MANHTAAAAGDEDRIAEIAARTSGAATVRVPLLPHDVHDLEGLATIADHLVGAD